METVKALKNVLCSLPQHESEYISMIDTDPDNRKLLYCCQCMMDQSAQKFLPKTLKTFKNFISSTSETFEKARSNVQGQGEVPSEFADQISKKGEYLEKLTNHLNQQKMQLKGTFNKIRENILKVLDETQKEYEEIIGDELKAACDLYREFERIVTAGWPKPSDLDQIFPLQNEIERRFSKVTDERQLASLIEGLNQDIKANQMYYGEKGKTARSDQLENFIKSFKDIESHPPSIDLTELQIGKVEGSLKEKINQILGKKAEIRNSISKSGILSISSLLQAKDLNLLHSWLPSEYKFNLKLLYKSSTNGQAASDFHSRCDNKGPTITLIKCRANRALKSSIIGGFADQNWHSDTSYQASAESFLFSLTSPVKCPIFNHANAIYGRADYGPTFGGGHDIYIANNFAASSYFNPHSYQNTKALADLPGHQNGKDIHLQPEEIEVYSVN